MGAEAIRTIENLSRSPRTIRKVCREEGVSSRKRRKKHPTKQCLREVKKRWALFQLSSAENSVRKRVDLIGITI
jgi:hypothetical protein